MRILLDACVPKTLRRFLPGLRVVSAREAGLNELLDGPMLDAASGKFDVIVTVDKSLRFQQQLGNRDFAVVVLRAKSNNIRDLQPLVPQLLTALANVGPGVVLVIGVV